MCEVINNGMTNIINKGVDLAVFVSRDAAAAAMNASRILVVRGISTAVIEVLTLDPFDYETLLEYAEKTGALVFAEQWLYEAVSEVLEGCKSVIVEVSKNTMPESIIDTATSVIKRKLNKCP